MVVNTNGVSNTHAANVESEEAVSFDQVSLFPSRYSFSLSFACDCLDEADKVFLIVIPFL